MQSHTEAPAAHTTPTTDVTVDRISYRGWPDCYFLRNAVIEAIVVPAIGRVMQLRLADEKDGAFWENSALAGQLAKPGSGEWLNFGGDKCWPAPQSDFPKYLGRAWPPPAAFDSLPAQTALCTRGILMMSPVDRDYGLQVVRRIELHAARPVMRITTEYHKFAGNPVRAGIWSITQMRDPELVAVLLPEETKLAESYIRLSPGTPASLHVDGRFLAFGRHLHDRTKIGTDGNAMVWVGKDSVVRIETEQEEGEYPDGGCVTEIYTNPDPLQYVELEAMSPLVTMRPGDRTARTTSYTIAPRTTSNAESEARRALGVSR